MATKIILDTGDIRDVKPPRYVYVVSASNHAGLKIGSTINIRERLLNLTYPHAAHSACGARGCERHEELRPHVVYADAAGLEGLLHATFQPWRIHGEWFDVSVRDIETVADVLVDKMEVAA